MVRQRIVEYGNQQHTAYFQDDEDENMEKIMAFNNSFRHYRNFYFSQLKPLLPSEAKPGYSAFCHCAFVHPIQDEATGELAEMLNLVSPVSHEVLHCDLQTKGELQKDYWAHHSYLRAVRKLYSSRIIRWNSAYNKFIGFNSTLDLQGQIPLTSQFQEEIQKQISNPMPLYSYLRAAEGNPAYLRVSPDSYLRSQEQRASLQWMMNSISIWPAKIIDQTYFLERANFKLPELHVENGYSNISNIVRSVSDDVGLSEILQEYSNKSSIPENNQKDIQRQIIDNFNQRVDEQNVAGPLEQLQLQEHHYAQAQPPLGSMSLSHGIGASPIFGIFGISALLSALLLDTYLVFRIYEFIYEFFVPQKETNIKDCLCKCGEQKISSVGKEDTFEPTQLTLTKLELRIKEQWETKK